MPKPPRHTVYNPGFHLDGRPQSTSRCNAAIDDLVVHVLEDIIDEGIWPNSVDRYTLYLRGWSCKVVKRGPLGCLLEEILISPDGKMYRPPRCEHERASGKGIIQVESESATCAICSSHKKRHA